MNSINSVTKGKILNPNQVCSFYKLHIMYGNHSIEDGRLKEKRFQVSPQTFTGTLSVARKMDSVPSMPDISAGQ